jgi:uncharacterized membrane protein YfcA
MGGAMDGLQILDLILFNVGVFAAALITGVAGFAFGIVAAAVWLHFLPPAQAASLIIAYGLIVQAVAVWKLRRSLQWRRLVPFLLGGAIGVPLGVELVRWLPAPDLRLAIGGLLVIFSLYNLFRPKLAPVTEAGPMADAAVGVVNGVIGGATGLAGIAMVVWSGLRGWSPPEQRAVFQPVGVAVFLMAGSWLGGTGMIGGDTIRLFLLGLPALAIGTWAGLKLFGRLDETKFRRLVLVLLLLSGVSLVVLGR